MKILKNYIVGRSNLAATIFVPYDCPNNCPFCTSKKEYENMEDFSLDAILKSIRTILNINYITDFVITGGEPFADLEKLQKILDVCKLSDKNIFINTTLPVKDSCEADRILKFISDNQDAISGINISRHICIKTKLESDDLIRKIHKTTAIPLRINSVLFNLEIEKKQAIDFIKKYAPIVDSINFRGDYTKIKNQDDLRTLDHPILDLLFAQDNLHYISSGGCLVCNNNDFVLNIGKRNVHISLHRGFEHSLVIKGNNYIINDIIIKQDGRMLIDWDGRELDTFLLRSQWK